MGCILMITTGLSSPSNCDSHSQVFLDDFCLRVIAGEVHALLWSIGSRWRVSPGERCYGGMPSKSSRGCVHCLDFLTLHVCSSMSGAGALSVLSLIAA